MVLATPLNGLSPSTRFAVYGTVFLLALLGLALLSAAEAALLGFSKIRRHQLSEESVAGIEAVERLLARPRRYVLTHLALTGFLTVFAGVAAVVAALDAAALTGAPPWLAAIAATVLAAALVTSMGHVLPKAFGAQQSERLSLRAAPALLGVTAVLAPVARLLESLMTRAYEANGNPPENGVGHFRSEEELKTFVTLGSGDGVLEEDEEEMIQSVIELGETRANEIMVPRIDISGVPEEAALADVQDFVLESGFSRIPVYKGSVDNVTGVLFVKDLLVHLLRGDSAAPARTLAKPAYFVPETMKLDDLLTALRERHSHMAIVLDEFGGTAGLVTMEDVLEEIVGEIFDEYDLRSDPVRKLDTRTAVVDARMSVDDLNDALGVTLPEEGPYDTVGGLVHHHLGRLGREGEELTVDGLNLVVEKVVNRRILAVRVLKPVDARAEPPAGSATRARDHVAQGSDA